MCYTIKIDLTREELEKRFGAKLSEPKKYQRELKVNAFSLPLLPVICNDNTGEIRLYHWGLVPNWVKDANNASEIRTRTFNARSETLAEKPSFRHVLNKKRCLVLTNGFYEWQTSGNEKIPYFIGLSEQPAFALAGLYDQWTNRETGEELNTFTIITTRANPMMEEIHNIKKRMPVILAPEAEKHWLDLSMNPDSTGVFEPFPENLMFAEKLK
ncbi:MAG: SOS response-associated peptidase [Bacteroidales bacterium]|nr:SOS response-associated peptidase [Bacteroidales bacterium]